MLLQHENASRAFRMNIGEISEYTPRLQFNPVATNPGFSNLSEFSFRAIGQIGIKPLVTRSEA